jgi:hypothetical protein
MQHGDDAHKANNCGIKADANGNQSTRMGGIIRRHVSTATVPSRRIGRQSTRYTRKECTHARLEASKPPRAGYGLAGAPLELSEKDSMTCTRKLAQGIEHRQDFHLFFISHLDQDFKVRACACLSVFLLCLCFLIRSLLTSRTSALNISPAFRATAMSKEIKEMAR